MIRFELLILGFAASMAACGPVAAITPITTGYFPTNTPLRSTELPEQRTLTVFAAASLTDAFIEIGHNFEVRNPGVKVSFNFAGSQTLATQLIQGAMADVFACANHTEMDKLVSANLIQKDSPKDFLTNKLLLILPKNNPANIQTLQDLARPGLKLVLADATVPAGKYARQVLNNMSKDATFGSDFTTKVLANVVSNETDVKLVVAKVQLGEADAGIVYLSDAVAAPDLQTLAIPPNYSVIARYPIAALAGIAQSGLASEFIAYVLSADGQSILKKWGFTPITA